MKTPPPPNVWSFTPPLYGTSLNRLPSVQHPGPHSIEPHCAAHNPSTLQVSHYMPLPVDRLTHRCKPSLLRTQIFLRKLTLPFRTLTFDIGFCHHCAFWLWNLSLTIDWMSHIIYINAQPLMHPGTSYKQLGLNIFHPCWTTHTQDTT